MPVAQLANASPIRRRRNGGPGRRAANRFGDERCNPLWPDANDRLLERVTAARRTERRRSAAGAPVRIGRRRADDFHQPAAVVALVMFARRRREGEKRIAVVRGYERDDRLLGTPPGLRPVLSRELERRLDGVRPTRERVHVIEVP